MLFLYDDLSSQNWFWHCLFPSLSDLFLALLLINVLILIPR